MTNTDAGHRLARLLTDMWFEDEHWASPHSGYPRLVIRVRDYPDDRHAELEDVDYDGDRNRLSLVVVEPGATPTSPSALDQLDAALTRIRRERRARLVELTQESADLPDVDGFIDTRPDADPPPPPKSPLDPADLVVGNRQPPPSSVYRPRTLPAALALISDLRSELATAYADLRAARGQRS